MTQLKDLKKITKEEEVANILWNLFNDNHRNKKFDKKIVMYKLKNSVFSNNTFATRDNKIGIALRLLKNRGKLNYDRKYIWINHHEKINFDNFFTDFLKELVRRKEPNVNVSFIYFNFYITRLYFIRNSSELEKLFKNAMRKNLISFGQLTGNTINISNYAYKKYNIKPYGRY